MTLPSGLSRPPLHARDDAVPVDRAAELVGRNEDVGVAGFLLLRHNEARAPARRVEGSHDQVDLLGQRIALALDPVDAPFVGQAAQRPLEIGIPLLSDPDAPRDLLELEGALRTCQVLEDRLRTAVPRRVSPVGSIAKNDSASSISMIGMSSLMG